MNNEDQKIRALLKQAVPSLDRELGRDLWPQMLRRLEERAAVVGWFDWVLLAVLALWLCLMPSAIPVLLYHL